MLVTSVLRKVLTGYPFWHRVTPNRSRSFLLFCQTAWLTSHCFFLVFFNSESQKYHTGQLHVRRSRFWSKEDSLLQFKYNSCVAAAFTSSNDCFVFAPEDRQIRIYNKNALHWLVVVNRTNHEMYVKMVQVCTDNTTAMFVFSIVQCTLSSVCSLDG